MNGWRAAILVLVVVAVAISAAALLTVKVAPAARPIDFCQKHPANPQCASVTPGPTASPSPTPSPTAVPTATPSPTASPSPTPSPTALPGACSRVSTAPINGTDATAAILADIAATPAGGTLCFQSATYRVNGKLHVENRNGLTIDGRGALFQRPTDASSVLWDFLWSSNIRLTNFDVRGGGTQCGVDRIANEAGHAIALWGSLNVTIDHVETSDTTGEAVYIAGGRRPSDGLWRVSDTVLIEDMMVVCTGRQGIAITDGGNHVTIRRVEFFNVAGYAFDIEPNGHPELGCPGAHDILFENNIYHANTVGTYIGIPHMVAASSACPVYNVTFRNNRSVGHGIRFYLPSNSTYRMHDIVISGNIGESVQNDYAIELHNLDNIQITNNVQPLKSGQPLVYQINCTNVTISGNTQ